MSDYKIIDPSINASSAASDTHTKQKFPLGWTLQGADLGTATSAHMGAGQFVYVRGSNVASVGQFVHISNNSAVLLASANTSCHYPVGVAAGLLSATSVFGFVQIEGRVDYARGTDSSIGANVPLYICDGTAGILVSNASVGKALIGVVISNSYTSSQSNSMSVQLFRPMYFSST